MGTDGHQTCRGRDLPEGCVEVVTLDGEAIVGVTRPWLVPLNDVISGNGSTSLSPGLGVQFHIRKQIRQWDKAAAYSSFALPVGEGELSVDKTQPTQFLPNIRCFAQLFAANPS